MTKLQSAPARKTTIQQVSGVANKMDALLALIFASIAGYVTYAETSVLGMPTWFWWLSAAFCAVTAYTSPMEKLGNKLTSKFVKVNSAK